MIANLSQSPPQSAAAPMLSYARTTTRRSAELEPSEDRVTITLPPIGYWKEVRNSLLPVLTIIAFGFVVAFGWGVVLSDEGLLSRLALASLFGLATSVVFSAWSIPYIFVAAAFAMRSRTTLQVTGDELVRQTSGLLGTSYRRWKLSDVSDVICNMDGLFLRLGRRRRAWVCECNDKVTRAWLKDTLHSAIIDRTASKLVPALATDHQV
jgi:hypothetical protein